MAQEASDFSTYLEKLCGKLSENHSVDCFSLSKMDLQFCTGCWSCWWKTPGKCVIHDDADNLSIPAVISLSFRLLLQAMMKNCIHKLSRE